MDISLILWGMALVLELFSGYLMVQVMGSHVDALFPIMMMIIGLVFLFLTNKERNKQAKYQNIFYKGYEKWVYYGCYTIIFIVSLAIITRVYQHFSLTSPVIMLTWLLPMLSYSLYQGVVICKEMTLRIANKEVRYSDIKKIKIETVKKKERIYLSGRDKNYYYDGNKEDVLRLKEIIEKRKSKR